MCLCMTSGFFAFDSQGAGAAAAGGAEGDDDESSSSSDESSVDEEAEYKERIRKAKRAARSEIKVSEWCVHNPVEERQSHSLPCKRVDQR